MFSNEIRQALELITGARLRSVYIVWTDLFIVLERMKRRRVMRKALAEMGFFGEVPKMSDLSQDTDVEIDNTIHRSFGYKLGTQSFQRRNVFIQQIAWP